MKKLKFLIVIITFVVMATGCDPDSDRHCSKSICFFDYKPTYMVDGKRIIDKGEKLNVQVDVSGVEGIQSYKIFTYSESKDGNIQFITNRDSLNSILSCRLITENNRGNTIINISTDASIDNKVYARVFAYSDKGCKSLIASADSHKTTISKNSELLSELDEVFDYIGGKSQYCNVDGNGVYNVPPSDNTFIKIAYSQIGYKEKKSKTYTENGKEVNALPKCTSKVDGSASAGGWQKYSNSNMSWCAEFVAWCMEKAGIYVPFTVQTDAMKTWAKNESRWHSKSDANNGKYAIHEGDIVKYNGHVGILYKNSSGSWRLIHGNWNNEVVETSTSLSGKTLEGYISMKGITY